MKILLVEDNQGDARLIKEMLSETDFDDYNIVDYRVIEDKMLKNTTKKMPNIPEDMKDPISLLVVWIKK